MDTNSLFHTLFLDHPDWLREFTGLPLPEGSRGSSRKLKQPEIRCDLLLKSADRLNPFYLIEFDKTVHWSGKTAKCSPKFF